MKSGMIESLTVRCVDNGYIVEVEQRVKGNSKNPYPYVPPDKKVFQGADEAVKFVATRLKAKKSKPKGKMRNPLTAEY